MLSTGWTAPYAREQYVAIYATYSKDGKNMCPLLACSPMEAIADFSALAHVNFIGSTLNFYGFKDVTCLEFITADNCAVNIATARECNVPLVGCASHRLALATRFVIRQGGYQPLIDEVAVLMDKLTTLKNSNASPRLNQSTEISSNDGVLAVDGMLLHQHTLKIHATDE